MGTSDGTFSDSTEQAVYALQKAAHITRDGVVGLVTEAALARGVLPRPRSTAGYVIEVDLQNDLLIFVRNGKLDAVLNTSTGGGYTYAEGGTTAVADTPTGILSTIMPRSEHYWRPRILDVVIEHELRPTGLGPGISPKTWLILYVGFWHLSPTAVSLGDLAASPRPVVLIAGSLDQKRLHVIQRDVCIGGDDRHPQGTSLRHQESVEGVSVMRWKVGHREGMTVVDGKGIDPDRSHAVRHVPLRIVWKLEPAQLGLDGDLPRTCRRKEEFVVRILERLDLRAKPFRFC